MDSDFIPERRFRSKSPRPQRRKPAVRKVPATISISINTETTRLLNELKDSELYPALHTLANQTWTTILIRYDHGQPRQNVAFKWKKYSELRMSRWALLTRFVKMADLHNDCQILYDPNYDMTWSYSGKNGQIAERMRPVLEELGELGAGKARGSVLTVDTKKREGLEELFMVNDIEPQEHLVEAMRARRKCPYKQGYPLRFW